jgi:hypothetical protein
MTSDSLESGACESSHVPGERRTSRFVGYIQKEAQLTRLSFWRQRCASGLFLVEAVNAGWRVTGRRTRDVVAKEK